MTTSLIQSGELAGILDSPSMVLIDARSFAAYEKGHIPGAVNLDLFAFHWFDTSRSGIEAFGRQTVDLFSFCGVDYKGRIVFYDDESGMLASRGVWLLWYLSHHTVQLLDGGFKKWSGEMRSIETRTNNYTPSDFKGRANPDVLADYKHVEERLEEATIIDARSIAEYDGSIARAARRGHIPNSYNIDFRLNLNGDGTLKDAHSLRRLYPFSKSDEIITYCQGAYRAANTFLALKEAGFEDVRVYLGSWGEWGNRAGLPVEI